MILMMFSISDSKLNEKGNEIHVLGFLIAKRVNMQMAFMFFFYYKKSEKGNDIHDILDLFKGWRRCLHLPTSTLIESSEDQKYHEHRCLFLSFFGI